MGVALLSVNLLLALPKSWISGSLLTSWISLKSWKILHARIFKVQDCNIISLFLLAWENLIYNMVKSQQVADWLPWPTPIIKLWCNRMTVYQWFHFTISDVISLTSFVNFQHMDVIFVGLFRVIIVVELGSWRELGIWWRGAFGTLL